MEQVMKSVTLSAIGLIVLSLVVGGEVCCKAQTRPEAAVTGKTSVPTQIERDNSNVGNTSNTSKSLQQSYSDLHKLPYQKKARRKQINYPDDCQNLIGTGDEYVLQISCRETLKNLTSTLPKEGCSYEPFQPELHRFREEIKGDLGILSYTVQETDTDGIEALAERLGTVPDNIIRNSKLQKPIKLTAGQELKYEKAELQEYVTNWLEENSHIKFYPLSPNKYLLEIRCWAGAYNLSNVYLLYDESAIPAKTKVLEFPDFNFSFNEDDKENEYPVSVKKTMVKSVSGVEFNSKTKELIALDRKTGIGYAGHYARYSFPNGKPKLEEYRAKFKEDGNGLGDDWQRDVKKNWKRYFPK